MSQTNTHRIERIRELLPDGLDSLLDVGCGAVGPAYPYADKAREVVAIDWKPRVIEGAPVNVTAVAGDFLTHDFAGHRFDAVLCADVFEHIPLEAERAFVERIASLVRPGGSVVVSVPQAGTYGWLDPYQVKPTLHRWLYRVGLYGATHNGSCDIRKGHKHYTREELAATFAPLQHEAVRQWGYLYDPLSVWSTALSGKLPLVPGKAWIERRAREELSRSVGDEAYNLAMRFRAAG